MNTTSILLSGAAAAAMAAALAGGLVLAVPERPAGDAAAVPPAETVRIAPGTLLFPEPGAFLRDGRPIAQPRRSLRLAAPLEIMRHQVSVGAYRRCVAAGACSPADLPRDAAPDLPVTGVSHIDAEAYAAWYSRQTGRTWRLPSAAEWAHAAGTRFVGDLWDGAGDADNPASAWLARYRAEGTTGAPAAPPQPRGRFGANEKGVVDLAGNVWEWTSTCYRRVTLAGEAETQATLENCGVRIAEGRHRAYMSRFIRDGKSGGCAVGTPPEHLGFRLVREPGPLARFALLWGQLTGAQVEEPAV